jgi:hypothetical protein
VYVQCNKYQALHFVDELSIICMSEYWFYFNIAPTHDSIHSDDKRIFCIM